MAPGAAKDVGGISPKYYYLTLGLLAICVIVGLYIALRFQREVNEDLSPATRKDLFDPLEKAFYSGLMDEEEFKRIQASMEKQRQDKLGPKPVASRPKPGPEPGEPERSLGGDPGPDTPGDPSA